MNAPVIENAPGLKWRKIKIGWQAIWRARADLVQRGYAFKSLRLWQSTPQTPAPDTLASEFIADRCRILQEEMLNWARAGGTASAIYDGTWSSLIECYNTDQDSPYHAKEYATRRHYDTLCRRIRKDCGDVRIADTDTRTILRLYDGWTRPDKPGEPQKISMGHALIGMMRTLTTFGKLMLKCPACRDIRSDLKDMRIKSGKPREQFMVADQIVAIRKRAHATGRHSIALAQALQFDVGSGVRQKDIIGEWVPLSEPGVSDVISGNEKWVKGLRGEEIDENLVLRHVTSKRKKLLVADLKLAPMVVEEFRMMAGLRADEPLQRHHIPATGPLIVHEQTGLPWAASNFRQVWREIATDCGISSDIRNMDTRASAVTEAYEAEAPEESIRKGATHSTAGMTRRYSRGDAKAVAEVMQYRAASRNKPRTPGS